MSIVSISCSSRRCGGMSWMVWRVMHRTGMWTGWMLSSRRGCILLMIVRVISRRWMSCVLNGDESLRASKIQDENALNASFEPQKSILCLPPQILPPPLIGNAIQFAHTQIAIICITKSRQRRIHSHPEHAVSIHVHSKFPCQ